MEEEARQMSEEKEKLSQQLVSSQEKDSEENQNRYTQVSRM